MHKSLV